MLFCGDAYRKGVFIGGDYSRIRCVQRGDGVEGWTGRGRGNGRKLCEKREGEEPEGGHGRGSKRAVKGRFPEKLLKKHGILLKKLGVKIFLSIFAP